MDQKRQQRDRRRSRRLVKVVSLALAFSSASVLVAACGQGALTPGVASIGSATTTTEGSTNPSSGGGSGDASLRFAHCMQTHGVPSFPEPDASGQFTLPAGMNTSSTTYQAAQSKCQRFMGGGLPAAGASTHPSAAVLATLLRDARCMRRHGISQFPDPISTMPSLTHFAGVISDRDGAILVFPASLDMQSPEFIQSAAACKFPLTNHG